MKRVQILISIWLWTVLIYLQFCRVFWLVQSVEHETEMAQANFSSAVYKISKFFLILAIKLLPMVAKTAPTVHYTDLIIICSTQLFLSVVIVGNISKTFINAS